MERGGHAALGSEYLRSCKELLSTVPVHGKHLKC